MVKIQDIDWAASDKPVLVTQDGCLRIMDLTLTESFSPLVQYEFQGFYLKLFLIDKFLCYYSVVYF